MIQMGVSAHSTSRRIGFHGRTTTDPDGLIETTGIYTATKVVSPECKKCFLDEDDRFKRSQDL